MHNRVATVAAWWIVIWFGLAFCFGISSILVRLMLWGFVPLMLWGALSAFCFGLSGMFFMLAFALCFPKAVEKSGN